jgi:transformation/transcription domain-associated protein
MALQELKTPPPGQEQLAQLRQRIITMFFKSLTSRSAEVVNIAKEGLKRVIQQQSLSKELLQSSLRPILVNLAHYKNLTMPLLVGLERLLELLSNWFNPGRSSSSTSEGGSSRITKPWRPGGNRRRRDRRRRTSRSPRR